MDEAAKRAARAALAQLGGINAFIPVQKFQEGGPVRGVNMETYAPPAAPSSGLPDFLSRFSMVPQQFDVAAPTFDRPIAPPPRRSFMSNISMVPPQFSSQAEVEPREPPPVQDLAAIASDENLTDQQKMDTALESAGLPTTDAEGKKLPVKDRIEEYKSLLSQVYGLDVERENRISGLNRAIMGFAIAAGESPRATQNIAAGMAVGAEAALRREESAQAREERLADLAVQQAFADEAAAQRARTGTGGTYTTERLRQQVMEGVIRNPDQFNVYDEAGRVDPLKVREQVDLMVGAMGPQTELAPLSPDQQVLVDMAKEAIDSGRDPAAVSQMLLDRGIDPSYLMQ